MIKMKDKGSVSMWIWITGSIIAGIMVFVAAISIGTGQWSIITKTKGVREFEGLLSMTQDVCSEDIGTRDQLRLELPKNVRAVYVAKREEKPPELVSTLISKGKANTGDYFCLQEFNKDPNCRQLNCRVNATYMGEPSPQLDLIARVKRLFTRPENHYFLNIMKTNNKLVKIEAGRLLQKQERPTCGNDILEPGEQCEDKSGCPKVYGSCTIRRCESCFCQPELDCSLCQTGRPRDSSDSLTTDWCHHCSYNETFFQGNCNDGIDNDCDGQIDDNDPGCQ